MVIAHALGLLSIVGSSAADPLARGPALAATGEPVLDQVELKNGARLEGRVVYEGPTSIVLRSGTRDREYKRSDVVKVSSRAAHAREGVERWRQIDTRDVGKTLDLGAFYARVGLEGEARLSAWYVLTVDPENQTAHEALGHERRRNGWFVRTESEPVPFEELDRKHAQWKDARELSTAHYRVKTNLALAEALAIAHDLEGLYRSFFDLFGADLQLYEVVEPMSAEVHADRGSFPEKLADRQAFYEIAANTVYVDASRGFDRGLLFHEATHQLLSSTARRVRSAPGGVPAWLDEGLAEYVRAGMTGIPGRGSFRAGLLARHHLERHARASEPYSLERMLGFASTDFEASTNPDLKYAQAYSFVQFALHGEGRKHRLGLLRFLRGTDRGQSSPTHLKAALETDLGELEEAWASYVRAVAGAK